MLSFYNSLLCPSGWQGGVYRCSTIYGYPIECIKTARTSAPAQVQWTCWTHTQENVMYCGTTTKEFCWFIFVVETKWLCCSFYLLWGWVVIQHLFYIQRLRRLKSCLSHKGFSQIDFFSRFNFFMMNQQSLVRSRILKKKTLKSLMQFIFEPVAGVREY